MMSRILGLRPVRFWAHSGAAAAALCSRVRGDRVDLLIFKPLVQERKWFGPVDFVRAFKLRESRAIGESELSVHALDTPEFLAREPDVDRIIFRAGFDHQRARRDQ